MSALQLMPSSEEVPMRTVLDTAGPTPSPGEYKDVLGRFCTGVTVVTSVQDGEPVGFTCQSFSALSLEPAQVLLCVQRSSSTWPRIRSNGSFVVNLLAADQGDLALAMAAKGGDKFDGIGWTPSANRLPVLTGVLAWLECDLIQEIASGDHLVVLAAVRSVQPHREAEPLLYHRGRLVPGTAGGGR